MLTIQADESVLRKLAEKLSREPAGARIRLQACVRGVGWGGLGVTLGLGVSMDSEPGDEECVVGGVPFVASGLVRMRSGDSYEIHREWFVYRVRPVGRGIWN